MFKDPLNSIHKSQFKNSCSTTIIHFINFSVEGLNSVQKQKQTTTKTLIEYLLCIELGTSLLFHVMVHTENYNIVLHIGINSSVGLLPQSAGPGGFSKLSPCTATLKAERINIPYTPVRKL